MAEWPEIRGDFLAKVESDGRPPGTIAREIGISRPTLSKILRGETAEPYAESLRKILRWMGGKTSDEGQDRARNVTRRATEEDVVEFFRSEANSPVERFLTSILANVSDPVERKLVAITVLSEAKRARLASGRPITPDLLDLERRLLLEN